MITTLDWDDIVTDGLSIAGTARWTDPEAEQAEQQRRVDRVLAQLQREALTGRHLHIVR